MGFRPEEISRIIQDRISHYQERLEGTDVGSVIQLGDGITTVYGLQDCMVGELLEFPHGVFGMAVNLEEEVVGAILLGPDEEISEGDTVKRTGRVMEVPVGKDLLGRVVDPLGQPLDGRGPIREEEFRPLEAEAPGVIARQGVKEPLQTGIKAIDAMTPIGRGQRELIIGDRQTGKTTIAIDTILNQRGKGVICVYVAIGQKASTIARLVQVLEEGGAMDYTTVVAATAADLAPLLYIAPFSGCAMGEHFLYQGGHALVVYDDLSKHANSYRSLSLLLRRPPGREAFPGDIFFLHSRLLERAAKLREDLGGGSLTALPIVETLAGDVSAYIPTNVISITDGQIFLESDLFLAGFRPAINAGISVSRVGGAAQIKAMKKVAGRLRLDLAQYRELETFAQFGLDLDPETKERLEQGKRVVEVLKQEQHQPMAVEEQVIIISVAVNGLLREIPAARVKEFEREFLAHLRRHHPQVPRRIQETGELEEEDTKVILDLARRLIMEAGFKEERAGATIAPQ